MKHAKLIAILVIIVAVVTSIELYFGFLQHREVANNVKIDGVFLASAQPINDFHLTDNHGKPFNKDSLMGHWTLMFFGFTNCPMVCPTTMSALNDMYQQLKKELPPEQLPRVVMISVDPDRDTRKRMHAYVTAFNPAFIGARADIKETILLEKQLHIAAAKMQVDGQGKNQYTINHSTDILLVNPKGELQAYLAFPHKADQMVKDYQLIVKTVG